MMARPSSASLQEIETTPELLDLPARSADVPSLKLRAVSGAGGGGAKGYPNLDDNKWLWGGHWTIAQTSATAPAPAMTKAIKARCRPSAVTAY